jgi:hypothetical protein
MIDSRIIKRYNAYYYGWCLAFGEHTADYDEKRDINCLFGEERIGLILSPGLRKHAQRELLDHHKKIPEIALSDDIVRMNEFIYRLKNDMDRICVQRLKDFLLSGPDLHMFLCSHLFYPSGTRIITFAKKKPLIIMYKKMQPLRLIVERVGCGE